MREKASVAAVNELAAAMRELLRLCVQQGWGFNETTERAEEALRRLRASRQR